MLYKYHVFSMYYSTKGKRISTNLFIIVSRLEVRISRFQCMFCRIKTFDLFLFRYSKSYCLLNNEEYNCHHDCCPGKNYDNSQSLNTKLTETTAIEKTLCSITIFYYTEKTYCQSTPQAVAEMNCYSTNRIINL